MYLPLLEVAVGRVACEHHESIFLNSKLLLLSLGTWSNSVANYHKKKLLQFLDPIPAFLANYNYETITNEQKLFWVHNY